MILFLDDWKNYPNAILHLSTKNESFIRLAALYKSMGIKNHAFMLALHNPRLEHVDPWSEDLSIEEMAMIVQEIKENPWYFFREVTRVPALAGSNATHFKINRANLAAFWCFFNHVTFILIQPRQTGKSFSIDTLMILLLNFGTMNTQINMLTRSGKLRAENLDRLKKIQEELPSYLDFRGKDDIFNTEEIKFKKVSNSYKGNLSNLSPKLANNVGRGFTTPVLHVDEGCFVPNIAIALPAALMAGNAARDAAKLNKSHYGTLITTTAGKTDDKDGKYIYSLWLEAAVWNEKFLDCENEEQLVTVILQNSNSSRANKRAMVNITMSYRQLGYSDEWMREKLNETLSEGEDADRDLFNRWTSGNQKSPIPKEYLEILKNNIKDEPRKDFYAPYNYLLLWYYNEDDIQRRIDSSRNFIIGIDTSEGMGRDDIAFHMRDSCTGETICTATFNEINLITLADFFTAILVHFTNSMMIIERKGSAITIMDYMVQKLIIQHSINPFKRLFNMIVQEKESYPEEFDKISRLNYYDEGLLAKYKKHLGFNTSGGSGITSRSTLFSTVLMHMLRYTAHLLYDDKLCTQIRTLEVRNGRIDHPEGGHDDLVIASLLSYWLMLNGKNLSFYGINTQLLFKENNVYIGEKYQNNSDDEEDYSQEFEYEFLNLLDEYKQERDEIVLRQLENRIRFIGKQLVNTYSRNISVEHMLDEINRERRVRYKIN